MHRKFWGCLIGGLVLLLALMSTPGVKGGPDIALAPQQAINQPSQTTTPITSTFTYQGQLKQGNKPVTGSCEMAFRLYDDASAGGLIGGPITPTVPVTNGLFTAQLSFGGTAFDGNARWLDIQVNCGNGFTLLTPRQRLTAEPYALYALNSGSTQALQSRAITTTAPASGQVLKWNGNAWTPALDEIGSNGGYWTLTGNAGTAPGMNLLGTTDQVSLTIIVSGTAALQIIPNASNGSPNLIGGYRANGVVQGVVGATISGGGGPNPPISSKIGSNVRSSSGILLSNEKIQTHPVIEPTPGANIVYADYGTVSGGFGNWSHGYASTVGGGAYNSACTPYTAVGGGLYNGACGQAATIGGGSENYTNQDYSTIPGGHQAGAVNYGQMAYASGNFPGGGSLSVYGNAQTSLFVMRNVTTDTTPVELFLDGAGQRLILGPNQTIAFDILIVARSQNGASAGYQIRGVIESDGNGSNFVGTPTITTLGEDVNGWVVSVKAGGFDNALMIIAHATAGSTPVRWVATVRTTEVAWPYP